MRIIQNSSIHHVEEILILYDIFPVSFPYVATLYNVNCANFKQTRCLKLYEDANHVAFTVTQSSTTEINFSPIFSGILESHDSLCKANCLKTLQRSLSID